MSQVVTSSPTHQFDASAVIAQGLGNITREQQEQVILHIASEMQQIMGSHKIGREVTGGILPPLCSQLWISEGRRFGGIEIDLRPASLPAAITVNKIKKLEPEFVTRTGVHVQRLNTSGLTYVIDFARRSNLMLPSEVAHFRTRQMSLSLFRLGVLVLAKTYGCPSVTRATSWSAVSHAAANLPGSTLCWPECCPSIRRKPSALPLSTARGSNS
jgi:hypothetical protein